MLKPRDSALPCQVVATKLRDVPPTPPMPGASPDPAFLTSGAFPTSFNRCFDAIVLELIVEHRRVMARNGLGVYTGQMRSRWSRSNLDTDPIDDPRPQWPDWVDEDEGMKQDGVTLGGTRAHSERSCSDDLTRQEDGVTQKESHPSEQAFTSENVINTPSGGVPSVYDTADANDMLRQAAEMSTPIRLRTTDSHHIDVCLRAVEEAEQTARKARQPTLNNLILASRRLFKEFARHPAFEFFIALMIVANAVIVGYEIHVAATKLDYEPDMLLVYTQTLCNALFLAELGIRVAAEGPGFFWTGTEVSWNWFDTVTVLTSVVFEIVTGVTEASLKSQWSPNSVRIAKSLRIMRLLRVARVSKLFSWINSLRVLVYSVLSTLRSLVWAMLLLLGIFYLFAALFTQAATEYRMEASDEEMLDEATKYWGSLSISMYTLFMSISGGVSWIEPVIPLGEMGSFFVVVFTVFISFTYFAALNVVTAVFCETAHQTATEDQHNRIYALEESRRSLVQKMEEFFKVCDTDSSGLLTLAEFEAHINDDEVQACFESLGIQINDAFEVFRLLDTERRGGVDVSDLIMGTMKLKGTAKSVDVVQVKHDVKMLRYDIRSIAKAISELGAQSVGQGSVPQSGIGTDAAVAPAANQSVEGCGASLKKQD